MIYEIDDMSLNCIRDISKDPVNDIFVCRDTNAPIETYYTVLTVKDHEKAKELIECFRSQPSVLKGMGSTADGFVFVLPYRRERCLNEFYMGDTYDVSTCEQICINLILECISCELPYPVLYSVLDQQQLNMEKDYSIYFNYQLKLESFDPHRTEQDCAVKCASIVLELLKPQAIHKALSYELLSRKVPKGSYQRFTDLYKDVKVASEANVKKGILKRIKAWFVRNQDGIFRFFLVICIILAVLTVLMLLSQLIFGDIPLLRLFSNPFRSIGTESMLQ